MNDTIKASIEELRSQIGEKIRAIKSDPRMADILRLQQALNTLEELIGEPRTSLSEAFGLDVGNTAVKPGEFYGLTPLEAAKRYLRRRGESRPFKDILDSIRVGGVPIPASDEDQVRLSLGRSTLDVVKVAEDLYGLIEFFPHVKRGGKPKRKVQLVGLQPGQPEPTVGRPDDESDESQDHGESES